MEKIMPLVFAASLLCIITIADSAYTQQRTQPSEPTAPELESMEFSSSALDLSNSEQYIDKDSTPEGKERLRQLESKAKETIANWDREYEKRRGPASERDTLLGYANAAGVKVREARQVIEARSQEIAKLERTMGLMTGDMLQAAQRSHASYQAQIANAQHVIDYSQEQMKQLQPRIDALNIELQPIDNRLQQLWKEMLETRKQWLEIRDPLMKYSRGDFESLRKVLDDWLLIDGLWVEGKIWAAVCAFEMEEYQDAVGYLESAEDIRLKTNGNLRYQLAVMTLRNLIGRRSPALKIRPSDVRKAKDRNEKVNDPLVHFLVGNTFADQPAGHVQAKANYEKALQVDSKYICATVAIARLQTISEHPKVSDPDAGIKTLLSVWTKTGQRSWRLASYLGDAYYHVGQRTEAVKFWNKVLESDASDKAKDSARLRIQESNGAAVSSKTKPAENSTAETSTGEKPRLPGPRAPSLPAKDRDSAAPPIRKWTAKNGNVIEAKLVGVSFGPNGAEVKLTNAEGRTYSPKCSSLSEADREYIRQQFK